MPECDECGDSDILARNCSYCEGTYCGDDLLPERHNCTALRANAALGPDFYNSRDGDDSTVTLGEDDRSENQNTSQPETTTVDAEYESGPDVAKDGSISGSSSEQQPTATASGPDRIKRALTGIRTEARFRGQCPSCSSYVGRTTERITQCSDCGWRPGLPALRLLTHWPNYRTLYRRTLSTVWSILKIALILAVLIAGISVLVGTGFLPIDDPVDGFTTSVEDTGEEIATAGRANITTVERAVHQRINDRRTEAGLEPLAYNSELAGIARTHSQNMAEEDFFAHEDPDGDGFEDRYSQAGYNCRVASGSSYLTGGENLAQTWWRKDVTTNDGGTVRYETEEELAAGIVAQWMDSPQHRETLLMEDWESEGIGIVIDDNGEVFATQNFC